MARFKASKALTKGPVSHSAPFQNIPIQLWEDIVWMLESKDDKISLLISCRAFLKNRGVFNIHRPAKGIRNSYRWSLLVKQVGSGGNVGNWAWCRTCIKMLPTNPEKWEGSQYDLPVRYRYRRLPVPLKNEYRRLCFQWGNKVKHSETCRGGNVMAERCPDCFLNRAAYNVQAGLKYM